MVAVPLDEILSAVEFVSASAPIEHDAYVSLETGQIHFVSESIYEEVPDDLDSDRYIAVPHRNDLDLGRNLVFRFAARETFDSYERVRDIFRHKGAYGRFKDLLERKGLLEKWYRFEAEETEKALREWCAENNIQIIEKSG